jgi:MinD superfamily P-loop ATPase
MTKVAIWSQEGGVGKSTIVSLKKNGEESYNIARLELRNTNSP